MHMNVRRTVDDVEASIEFYRHDLGFDFDTIQHRSGPAW
jgi:hypothetical protein